MPFFRTPSRRLLEETARYIACGQFGGLLEVHHYEGPNSSKFIAGAIVFTLTAAFAGILYWARPSHEGA